MKKTIALTAILATLVIVSSAQAAFLYDWSGDPSGTVQTILDPSGDQVEDSRDILAVWYANDGSNHYFRLDLRGAPLQAAGEYAPEYAIYVDSAPGGGSSANSSYIAGGLSSIESILIDHFTTATAHTMQHRHIYQGPTAPLPRVDTAMLASIGGSFDAIENSGETLQWAIPFSELDSLPFAFYGATLNIDETDSRYDLTKAVQVPEPATLLLLGFSALALRPRRRRHVSAS